MEQRDEKKYRLPTKINSHKRPPAIELLARALDVPLGYLLGGFSDEQIENSIYASRVKSGEIQLVHVLRPEHQSTSLRAFANRLPTSEEELLGLPLYSYSNQFAFCVIFRIERLYEGLEMLLVNEPPLILWGEDDIELWVQNMKLDRDDAAVLTGEFRKYQSHFRMLARTKAKHYKVVANYPTVQRFLMRKSHTEKLSLLNQLSSLLKLPNFDFILYRPQVALKQIEPIEEHEAEVLCKEHIIPPTLEQTISVQIQQTPPHQTPVSYFVSPLPKNLAMIQKEIGRIDQRYAASLDQYRQDLGYSLTTVRPISKDLLRSHTLKLLDLAD